MKKGKRKLGEMLLDGKEIQAYQLSMALEHQKRWGGKLGSILIEMGSVKENVAASYIEKQRGWKSIALNEKQIPHNVLDILDYETAKKYHVIPLGIDGGRLIIATSNPIDCKTIDEISFSLNLNVKAVFAFETSISNALQRVYRGRQQKN
jgi:type IV pilus assembly protein PilB